MPRGKKTNGPSGGMPEFVSVQLEDADLGIIRASIFDDASVVDFLVKCGEAGIKVSIAYDTWNDATICTLTAKSGPDDKRGVALSSRGPGVHEAITVAAYKLHTKLDSDFSQAQAQDSKRSWS